MCDEHVYNLQSVQQPIGEKVPKVVLRRVEEIFPSLKESSVSFLCLCAEAKDL
jgi:hypothetical protein